MFHLITSGYTQHVAQTYNALVVRFTCSKLKFTLHSF